MKVIDCHTHLQTIELAEEYFKNKKNYFAIAIKSLDSLIGNGNEFYEVSKCENIFICECIDIDKPVQKQLKSIKQHMKKHRIIGIKIYLGYQHIYADDEKLTDVYNFANDNLLSIVYHCGVGADNLSYNTKYSSSLPIEVVAKKYPTINFIASHFDYPNFDDCAKIVSRNKNIFTDISGVYENYDNKEYATLMKNFEEKIQPTIEKYNKKVLAKKVMFGTDYFGNGSGFNAVEEYVQTCKNIFGKENLSYCLYKNILNAYPKINEYI